MSDWLIKKWRKGKQYNVFDVKLHSDNRVMISLGDYSPFGGTKEMNIWFDGDEFNEIYYHIKSIYEKIKENKS